MKAQRSLAWLAAAAMVVATAVVAGPAAPALAAATPATHIFSRDGNADIVHMWQSSGGSWHSEDITRLTNALRPDPRYQIRAYQTPDGVLRVVYVDATSFHVHEIYQLTAGGGWNVDDLTVTTGAASARTAAFPYYWNGNFRIVFIDANNHVVELYLPNGGTWHRYDLTAATGAPAVSNYIPPTAYVTNFDVTARVLFGGGSPGEIYLPPGGTWHYDDLRWTSTVAGNPDWTVKGLMGGNGDEGDVFYRSGTEIINLRLPSGGTWSHQTMVASHLAPAAESDPSPYRDSYFGNLRVAYTDANNHVQLFTKPLTGTADWSHADISGPIPAAPNVASGNRPALGLGNAPMGVYSSYDSSSKIAYLTDGQHIGLLTQAPSGVWGYTDVTAASGAYNSDTDPYVLITS